MAKGQQENPFNFHSYMVSMVASINAELDLALPLCHPLSIHQAMRYSVLAPGNRIYAFLCIAACEVVGGSHLLAIPTACALEMLHAASLIHDDLPCMDNDDIRCGQPTNHKVFGEGMSILAADALFALAIERVAGLTHGVSADKVLKVVAELSRTVGSEGMVAGQFTDLATKDIAGIDLRTLDDIHMRKIAMLAECSTVCGAILGGAHEHQIDDLRLYGRSLGLLYQVMDEILEVAKTSDDSGIFVEKKEKATYPKFFGIENAKEFVKELGYRAKNSLVNFDGKKAAPLLGFVDFAVTRQNPGKLPTKMIVSHADGGQI